MQIKHSWGVFIHRKLNETGLALGLGFTTSSSLVLHNSTYPPKKGCWLNYHWTDLYESEYAAWTNFQYVQTK